MALVSEAAATTGGMPTIISMGVVRKPPPTPNKPERKPITKPTEISKPILMGIPAIGKKTGRENETAAAITSLVMQTSWPDYRSSRSTSGMGSCFTSSASRAVSWVTVGVCKARIYRCISQQQVRLRGCDIASSADLTCAEMSRNPPGGKRGLCFAQNGPMVVSLRLKNQCRGLTLYFLVESDIRHLLSYLCNTHSVGLSSRRSS